MVMLLMYASLRRILHTTLTYSNAVTARVKVDKDIMKIFHQIYVTFSISFLFFYLQRREFLIYEVPISLAQEGEDFFSVESVRKKLYRNELFHISSCMISIHCSPSCHNFSLMRSFTYVFHFHHYD